VSDGWDYSDYVTYDHGTASRLSRLRLHIKEVSDKISTGDYATDQKSHSQGYLANYLKQLKDEEKAEAITVGASSGDQAPFTRGRGI
jgi:uncharacterized protein YraI